MSFPGYAHVAGGGGDDAAYFGASVDVDGAVDAALRALDDGPSLGASAGDGSNAVAASGRGASYYGGRPPGPQAPRRRPLGPNAVVAPPPSLPDSVFLLPGPSERRRQAQAEAAAAAAEAAAAAAAAPRRGGRLALLTEDSAAEAAAARESSSDDEAPAPSSAPFAAPSPAARREEALEEARRAAAAAEYAHRASYGTEEAPEDAGWSPDVQLHASSSRAASVASPAPSVPTRSPPASVSSAETSADAAFARGYRAALAAAQEQAAAVPPSPPPAADAPIPLPRRSPAASPVPPSSVVHRTAQRGEEGYAESVVSGDEGGDDPFEARARAAVAPPAGLLGRVRAPGSTMGTAASSSADWSEDSWMRPARSDEILTARTAHDRWGAPALAQPLQRNVAASSAGSDVSSSWAGSAAASQRSVPQAPPVYVVEDARDKFAAVAASVARAQAEAAVHKTRNAAAPDPRTRRPEPAPPPSAPANAPPRRAAPPGGLQADPGPPIKREAYRPTDEDHRVPVPDLVGDFTIVPGALLEAGTRLVSAVRAEIDKDVAAKRHRAAQTLENIVLGLSPGRSFEDEDGAPLLPWQKALLQVGASVEQELERRQARASAAFRAMEQEQLRISLLMQNTAGAAATGGKTVLQRWLEGAFGSKAEYDAYISGIAATMCMAPGAKMSFVNILRSLEPMRKEAVANRQARLASAHHATRMVTASGPDAAVAVLGLPADAPPPLAPGTPSPMSPSPPPSVASSMQPPSRAGGMGTMPQYAQSAAASSDAAQVAALQAQVRQQYMTSARQNPPPPSSVMPGPWEPPVLDVRRPGSPQESVVLERLPGMTDEDLERLADFMGSDAGSIWGDGTDPDELTEAEAAERVARMVAEARAAAAMRAAAKRANSAQRDDFADEDAEVAAVRGNRPGSGYSDIAASTPEGMRQQNQPAYAASQQPRSGGAASPAPSYNGQRLPQREPSPLPPSADFGYNSFSYDAPSENTRAAWEAQLARRGGTAPPSAAGDSVYGARRGPPPSSVASGHPAFFRSNGGGDDDMDPDDDFSYQAPPGRSVHGSFAGSAAPSVAPSMPMMRDATRQPSTGPSSSATSVAAPEDFGRVPPAPSLWARATAPAQPPMPPPRRGAQPLPAAAGPGADAISAARAAAVASLAPKPKAPVSESDWGFDRSAVLDRKRPEADRSLAASMAAAGIGGGGGPAGPPDAPSPTGWVRDRGTGAWSPAQSRPGSRADFDAPAAAAPAGAQRRAPKTAAPGAPQPAQSLKVNTTVPSRAAATQRSAPVAVVDERWQRLIADALRVAVLLVLGAVLAFVLVLTFF